MANLPREGQNAMRTSLKPDMREPDDRRRIDWRLGWIDRRRRELERELADLDRQEREVLGLRASDEQATTTDEQQK